MMSYGTSRLITELENERLRQTLSDNRRESLATAIVRLYMGNNNTNQWVVQDTGVKTIM